MRPPRPLETLNRDTRRNRLGVLGAFVVLAVLLSAIGLASLAQGTLTWQGAGGLIFVEVLWVGLTVGISRTPLLPADFSLAEIVLYELNSLATKADEYSEALKSSPARLDIERKRNVVRRHVVSLFTTLAPYRSQLPPLSEREQPVAGPANLFVGELSDFADQMTTVLKTLAGLLKALKPIPTEITGELVQFRSNLEHGYTRLTEDHLAPLRTAVKAAQESRIPPDETLETPLNTRFKMVVRNWLSSRHVAVLLGLDMLGGSAVFIVAILTLEAIGTFFPVFELAMLYFTFLLVLIGIWAGLQAAGPRGTRT